MTDGVEQGADVELAVDVEEKKMASSGNKKAIDAKRGVNTFAVDPGQLVIVGRDTKHKRGEHPLWQDRALEDPDEALVQDMMARGFTSVIDVRKDGPRLEVVAGRRRVIAAREANRRLGGDGAAVMVQCKVFRGSNSDAALWVLGENANRKDLSPLQMAYDLQNCINFGASDDEAARACGKTPGYMRQLLSLLDLGAEAQKAVVDGLIAPSSAFSLASLTRDEQKVEVEKIAAGEYKPTRAAIEGAVKAVRSGEATVTLAPNKTLLRKLIAHEDAERVFGEDGLLALRWVVGDAKPRTIAGLSDLIRKVNDGR